MNCDKIEYKINTTQKGDKIIVELEFNQAMNVMAYFSTVEGLWKSDTTKHFWRKVFTIPEYNTTKPKFENYCGEEITIELDDLNPVVKYEILFDIDSLMGTTSDPVKYEGIENTTYKESSIKPPQVTSLPGYKFLDWEPEFDPYDIIIGDKTFKAKFEEITACVPAKIKNIVATPLGNNGYKFDISFTKPVTLFETSKFWAEEWPSTTQTNWQNSYNGNIHKGNGLKLLVVFKDECDNVFEIDYNYLRPYMDK